MGRLRMLPSDVGVPSYVDGMLVTVGGRKFESNGQERGARSGLRGPEDTLPETTNLKQGDCSHLVPWETSSRTAAEKGNHG